MYCVTIHIHNDRAAKASKAKLYERRAIGFRDTFQIATYSRRTSWIDSVGVSPSPFSELFKTDKLITLDQL